MLREILIGVAMLSLGANTPKEVYPLTTIVSEVDKANDIVVCEDYNGNLWEFYGTEDWEQGDICSLLMSTNGTQNIKDDIVVSARYNGNIKLF